MRRRRKRKGPIAVPTTSMGDIAFLLTIFFMICSNFAKESGIRYTPPRSRDVAEIQESGISVVVDERGDVFLDGRRMSRSDALESALEMRLQGKPAAARNVMFKCDQGVDRAVFEPVLEAIVRAGGVIVAVGEKSQKP